MMNFFTITRVLLTALLAAHAIALSATSTGICRTAITLKNGTQEIYPDSSVTRFTYSQQDKSPAQCHQKW